MSWERRFRDLAERQEGLVGKIHLPFLGAASSEWWSAARSGRWDLVSSRVLRLCGTPETEAQRVLAAVLDGGRGAVLHGLSTLAWFGLRRIGLRDLHVARPRGLSGAPTELAQLHQLRALRAHHVMVARGVPTETPLRAIWSEAARFSKPELFEIGLQRVGRLLDDAHVANLVTWAALHEMVDDIRERGRAGTTIMRALAAKRRPGSSPTESRNEDQLEKILANAGVRPLGRQHVVGGHEPVGRCDFRDLELPLVVEVNSLAYHTTPSDRAADEDRYLRLNDAAFAVCVIWEDDLWSRPSSVIETLKQARKMATVGDHGVIHSPSCPWPRPERL